MADPEPPRDGSLRARLTGPVAQFAWAGLIAVVVMGAVAALLTARAADEEALLDAKRVSTLVAHGIVEPAMSEGVLEGRPGAVARLDRIVDDRVLEHQGIARVKIWDADSRIVYSDEPRLVGEQFSLGDDDLRILREGGVEAEESDLDAPENRFDRGFGDLVEVYLPIESPRGEPLLFEAYLTSDFVASSGDRIFSTLAPVLLGALLLLAVLLLPLAARLARRLRQGQVEREALLHRAIESSMLERRRVAQDLHDGVVQELAGTSFALSAASRGPERTPDDRRMLGDLAGRLRQSVRDLRGLLVEIYPPDLRRAGLGAALSDVLAGVEARGMETRVEVPPDLELPEAIEALFFRAAQEGIRNAVAHADAGCLEVRAGRDDGLAILEVRDDGRGFSPTDDAHLNGHFGLRTIRDLTADLGGRLTVDSRPGEGTRLKIEVPIS